MTTAKGGNKKKKKPTSALQPSEHEGVNQEKKWVSGRKHDIVNIYKRGMRGKKNDCRVYRNPTRGSGESRLG